MRSGVFDSRSPLHKVTYGGYSAEVPIEVTGPNGRMAVVISGWYVADADPERRPSLTRAYVDI